MAKRAKLQRLHHCYEINKSKENDIIPCSLIIACQIFLTRLCTICTIINVLRLLPTALNGPSFAYSVQFFRCKLYVDYVHVPSIVSAKCYRSVDDCHSTASHQLKLHWLSVSQRVELSVPVHQALSMDMLPTTCLMTAASSRTLVKKPALG